VVIRLRKLPTTPFAESEVRFSDIKELS
jgi:hypothetical protein